MAGKLGMKHANRRMAKPVLLQDAEYVSSTAEEDPERPDTAQQRALREEKEKSPSKFMDRLMRLEQMDRGAKLTPARESVASAPSVAVEEDQGVERVLEVGRAWLERHKQE